LARFIDGGVAADGRPWFALEYVEGDTITRWCDAQRLSVRDRVRLFLDVCATVQYAHAQLVVHRDLKPANVLVGGDGTVRLLDFGIARLLDGGDDAPATLATLGVGHALTPEYAAPEQFLGETAGAGTDVYSLGVILYELVTGALPYVVDRGDLVAAQRTVLETLPDAPTQAIARSEAGRPDAGTRLAARRSSIAAFRSTVRGDLSRILDKALAKEPARRYTSVEAFAADLGRWLTGEPVHVSGNGVGYRLRKFIGRHRLVVALGALALTVAAIGLTTTVWQMREARIQRNDALAAARRADAVRDYLMLMLGTAGTQQDSSHIDVREVFRSGARRLHDEFRDQPRTGQSAALMLSDLFLQVADFDGAEALLEQLLQWPGIEDNPEVLANARYNLAQIEISRGHATRARELLQQAQDWWRDRPGDVALLRNESASTQAKIERAEGRADQAIATLRDAVAERARLLARPDFES
uniref:serine/threonine protein kinase n=1 Tax=Dokdonella sp. TaxID=2291710 RepID=UPI0027B9F54C